MRYFIIGYKSSGKTTIGKKLAYRLNMEFIDLDKYIEDMTGSSVPEIYTSQGETEFRNIEWKALKQVVTKDNVIVSTGGGVNEIVWRRPGRPVFQEPPEQLLELFHRQWFAEKVTLKCVTTPIV